MDNFLSYLVAFATGLAGPDQSGGTAPVPTSPTTGTVVAAPATKGALTAAETVDRVQAFYAGVQSVKARFRQSVTNVTFGGAPAISDGVLYITKPGKMRWDYSSKVRKGKTTTKKSIISNGQTLWLVEHDNKQVIKKDLASDLLPVTISFLYGKGDLKQDFNAEIDTSKAYGAADEVVLRLSPKQPSAQYKTLFLVVHPSNYRVRQSIVVDAAGNVNHFRFFEPDFAAQPNPNWFEFDFKSVPTYRLVEPKTDAAPVQPAPATPAANTVGD